jgi:hypothetical protein
MARPRKAVEYIVQRIADLFRYADGLPSSRFPLAIMLAEKRVLLRDRRDIHAAIGWLLCDVKPNLRPYVLNRLADALKEKPRKSSPDDIAKIREAHRRAGDNPTFRKVDAEYHKLTGFPLSRRALKDADCPVLPGKSGRPKKLPRQRVTRNRGKGVRP